MLEGFLATTFGKILATFVVAMLPVVELRGAIPAGYAMGLEWPVTYIASVLGNMLPVPFILFFIRSIFLWLKDRNYFAGLIYKLEKRALSRADVIYKYELIGLCIFVAIPLPGTGAWTGALIAALLDMRIKNAVPAILIGVLVAGVLMTGATYGLFDAFAEMVTSS